MVAKTVLAASLAGLLVTAATGIAVVVDDQAEPEPRSAAAPEPTLPQVPSPVFNLTWDGYYKLGLADCAMIICPAHTYETEPVVGPFAKAGFRVDIPADTSLLEFDLRWTGAEKLHLMIHGPMKPDHSMPSYMGMGTPGRICLAIPGDQIVPGMWEVMAHAGSMGYQDTPFSIQVNGEGGSGAAIRAGPHGHPIQEDWGMEMRQGQDCRS